MARRKLSPEESYKELLRHAAVVVEIRDSEQEIVTWEMKQRAPLIAFVDGGRRISHLEVSFMQTNPYGRREQNPLLLPRERVSLEIPPLLWEFIKWVILMLARERREGKKLYYPNGYRPTGKRFWRRGKSLRVGNYRGWQKNGLRKPLEHGVVFGVSDRDTEILDLFFAEEPSGLYWKKRIGWFAQQVDNYMSGWRRGSRKGLGALRKLVSEHAPEGFFRREIFLSCLARVHRQILFLDTLKEFGTLSLAEHQEYCHRVHRRKQEAQPSSHFRGVELDFRYLGMRRGATHRFEVFPEEERR